jgi:hypothetical protein
MFNKPLQSSFAHISTNPSLGSTTRNVTPQLFWTHSILGQYRTHLRKGFISNFISKEYPSHVRFETSIGFTKTLILRFQMSGQGKSFKKVSL